ncbi:MAG: hypothetical protein RL660_2784 [Bacteroidota bacterium]
MPKMQETHTPQRTSQQHNSRNNFVNAYFSFGSIKSLKIEHKTSVQQHTMKRMKQIGILATLAFICLSIKATAQPFTQPLYIMDTLSGTSFNLNLQAGSHQFYPGVNTATNGYNSAIFGPTLIMRHGDSVTLNVTNNLSDTSTTHWHGLHIPAIADGGPHQIILPGQTWSPTFKVMDKAATYWYHPHLHMKTEEQVAKGAVGLIIVKDNEEASKALPRTYGVDDFPLVFQSKILKANNGQIALTGPWDTVMTINGVVKPYLEVPAQPVRFRMLNGSSRRVYMLGLSDDRQFHQIATDGSLTPQPRQMNRLRIVNGERSEIVIDFTGLKDSVYYLMCYGTEIGPFIPGGAAGGGGMGANPYDSADYALMEIRVKAPTSTPVAFDPSATLTTIAGWNAADADTIRKIRLTGGVGVPFSFDSVVYDHHTINHIIQLGSTEIWELRNTSFLGHPFHLHDVQFMVLDKDGLPPPVSEQGLKDVIFVEAFSTTRFITQFTDFADSLTPYMYHCHNMAHEDGGMMGQFIVVDSNSGTLNTHHSHSPVVASVYPNPSTGKTFVKCDRNCDLKIYNTLGQCVLTQSLIKGKTELTLHNKGLLLFVFDHHGVYTVKTQLMAE